MNYSLKFLQQTEGSVVLLIAFASVHCLKNPNCSLVQIIFLPLFLQRSSLPNFFRDQFSSNASSIVSFSFTAGQQSGTTSKRTQVRLQQKRAQYCWDPNTGNSNYVININTDCIQSGRPASEYQTEVRYLDHRL